MIVILLILYNLQFDLVIYWFIISQHSAITKWIKSEVDYNFLNPGYTIAFNDEKVLLEQNDKELKQVCPHCLLVLRYSLFFKCGHLTCLSCFREYRRHRLMFEKMIPCPICQQSCSQIKSIHIKWRRKNVQT